jgi:hypothetical protein
MLRTERAPRDHAGISQVARIDTARIIRMYQIPLPSKTFRKLSRCLQQANLKSAGLFVRSDEAGETFNRRAWLYRRIASNSELR